MWGQKVNVHWNCVIPKSVAMTFSGTWGSTSFTCWAILAILWSSVPKLWTMKPSPIEPGLTPRVRRITDIYPKNSKAISQLLTCTELDLLWVYIIYILVEVCGTVCLFLLMCSALSALVILVETKPSSPASSWKRRYTQKTHFSVWLQHNNRKEGQLVMDRIWKGI